MVSVGEYLKGLRNMPRKQCNLEKLAKLCLQDNCRDVSSLTAGSFSPCNPSRPLRNVLFREVLIVLIKGDRGLRTQRSI